MQEVVPVKKRVAYRTVEIQSVVAAKLGERLGGAAARCIVAIDVAKEKMVVGFADGQGVCQMLVRFSHPTQTLAFLALLEMLRDIGLELEVAMEPTGVYGEALRYQLVKRSFAVFRVDPTRSHAMASVLDGVPSLHDAKSCTLISYLHARGISVRWKERDRHQRTMRALIDEHRLHYDPIERARGHLEAAVAEYFPELSAMIDSSRGWHLHLLEAFPSPAHIAAAPEQTAQLLRRVTRGRLAKERIDDIIDRARRSLGEPMVDEEAARVSALAKSMLYHRERLLKVEARIRGVVNERPQLAQMVDALGPVTSAAIIADLGDPAQYESSAAFEKALGLNLKEKSSGTSKGALRITKRGSPRARKYLYLAALRAIQWHPVVRAWYEARSSFKSDQKLKAVVAVMRKLARAIVHLARGKAFDASKLFDVRRLTVKQLNGPFGKRASEPDESSLTSFEPAAQSDESSLAFD